MGKNNKAQNADLHLGLYVLCLVQMKARDETVYVLKKTWFEHIHKIFYRRKIFLSRVSEFFRYRQVKA